MKNKLVENKNDKRLGNDSEQQKLKLPRDYFVPVHPAITFVIFVGLFILVQMAAWCPQLLDYLGNFGETLHIEYAREIRIFFLVCLAIHIFEGIVGFALAGMSFCDKDKIAQPLCFRH